VTLEQLNAKYSLVDRQKHFEIIDFFDANSLTIQNLDENKDIDTLTSKLCFLSDFAYALAQSGQSTKSIPFLKDSIRLQEQHPNFIENKLKSKNYEFLVFELGRALHKTGNIDESIAEFQKLVQIAPDNEGYKTWIIGAQNYRRNRILRFVYISFTVWLFIDVLFRKQFPTPIDLIYKFVGLILFGVWSTLEIANFLTKRKYGRKITPRSKMYRT
jgi:tetratricopeptide (TPR) repeat protein